jgi:RHS repeat-associated protein
MNRVYYQKGYGDQFIYKYEYDADNRITAAYSSRNGLLWQKDARYYYYLHGPVARVELGKYNVQGTDYAYTLQGWLKGINSQSLDPLKDMAGDGNTASPTFQKFGRDVVGLSQGFFNGDYKPIGNSTANAFDLSFTTPPSPAGTTGNTGHQLFNGNISYTTLALSMINNGQTTGYSYLYDQLNRITSMKQHSIAGTAWSYNSANQEFFERISYDANGNINTYVRNGANAPGMPLGMDNLKYFYYYTANDNTTKEYDPAQPLPGDVKALSNQLAHIDDTESASNYPTDVDDHDAGNYDYDNTGNLIKSVRDSITSIDWTVSGKVKKVTKSSGITINYGYDATGKRVVKQVMNGPLQQARDFFIRDAAGNVIAVYKDQFDYVDWSEQHLYGDRRLGVWSYGKAMPGLELSPGYDSMMVGSSQYELGNAVGNIVATISDKKTGVSSNNSTVDYYKAEVISQNDYYPFGMLMPNRNYNFQRYRYSINGQDKELELNENITSAEYWMYDSRIARRWNMDPVVKENESPYAVFANNPIWNIDPDGSDTARQVVIDALNTFATDMKAKMESLAPRIKQLMDGISTMKKLFNNYVAWDLVGSFNPLYFAGALGRQLGMGEDPVDYMGAAIAKHMTELQTLVEEYNSAYENYQNVVKSMDAIFKNSTHVELNNGLVLDKVSNNATKMEGGLAGLVALTTGLHKNKKTAQGTYALYEIIVEGKTFKFGLADANRVRQGGAFAGYPERLAQQLSKMTRLAPDLKITAEIKTILTTTKAEMLLLETKTILAHAKTFGIPIGNVSHLKKWGDTFGKSGLAAKALRALSKYIKFK